MKLLSNLVIGAVILFLLSMMSPAIKGSIGDLFSSVSQDTNHAVATVTESGGFSDTWNSLTKLGSEIVSEVTNETDK